MEIWFSPESKREPSSEITNDSIELALRQMAMDARDEADLAHERSLLKLNVIQWFTALALALATAALYRTF